MHNLNEHNHLLYEAQYYFYQNILLIIQNPYLILLHLLNL